MSRCNLSCVAICVRCRHNSWRTHAFIWLELDLCWSCVGIFTLLDDIVKGPGKPETKDSKFSQTLDNAAKTNQYYVPANEHRGVQGDVFSVR